MSLKKIEGEHEEEAFLQCISELVGSTIICEGTLFAVGLNDSSPPTMGGRTIIPSSTLTRAVGEKNLADGGHSLMS